MNSDLRELKVGDTVFIVPQKRRHCERESGFEGIVSAVGRKYATAKNTSGQWIREFTFHRDSGCSKEDPNSNARVNGYGFDVYSSESDYNIKLHQSQRMASLLNRLDCGYQSKARKLTPEAVEAIHSILDQHE